MLLRELYVIGDNDEGQLGDGSTQASTRPRLITSLQGIATHQYVSIKNTPPVDLSAGLCLHSGLYLLGSHSLQAKAYATCAAAAHIAYSGRDPRTNSRRARRRSRHPLPPLSLHDPSNIYYSYIFVVEVYFNIEMSSL